MNEEALLENIESIKGIGEKTAKLFDKVGVTRINDLLHFYPRNYDIFEPVIKVENAVAGNTLALRCQIVTNISVKKVRNLSIITFDIADNTGRLKVTFFNTPYLRSSLKSGHFYIFRGLLKKKGSMTVLEQPKIYEVSEYLAMQGTMQPRYSLVKGLSNNTVVKAVTSALESSIYLKETVPSYLIFEHNFMNYRDAVRSIHFPKNQDCYERARKRLAYDEFLFFIIRLRLLKLTDEELQSKSIFTKHSQTDDFLQKLPFELTNAQKKVWEEIKKDLKSEHVMNRLVQGDVGCGKTILAFLSLLMAVENGYQGALMAPTEVLARQHYEDLLELSKKYSLPIKPVLMVGSLTAKQKKENRAKIADGTVNVCIGTNALIQEPVKYKNLSLVITDEQHRFGVRQREKLAKKGNRAHILAMSATPIPRTLAIVLYGDLHVSIVDEMPKGRLPIKNSVVDESYRPAAYKFINKQIKEGHQAYVICPMIEEGEMNDVENVTDYTTKLREALPGVRIEMLNGKMKPSEKDKLMEAFSLKQIDILVSTTVIEVGINVPNATVMMIENAQRFGLAQLHQLRGRVGRGKDQSYCIFINTSKSKEAENRLKVLGQSNDGFYIANEDLKQRGPGDLFGIAQSGDLYFKLADIYADSKLVQMASIDADRILSEDPTLELPQNTALLQAVTVANENVTL
ncbi:ATP-dependent DNA helicase RecG [Butyrivibrio sp. NC3005]|uniref:ATP-dependent DNA helicase RecG n=1 Tax=Butyrivibrio sp. NC3005 TaxID=1280685 RepID=UPI0003F70614|nr:ATP-dependent DNA helicase RecG [Butyrivibrio sp. NC3005]